MSEGSIRIGTLVKGDADPAGAIAALSGEGFESFSLSYWESVGGTDPAESADGVVRAAQASGAVVSSLSAYGNPLRDDEAGEELRRSLRLLIEAAPAFGAPLVSTFAGRVPGRSVPDSIDRWRRTFEPLFDLAEKSGVSLAFENCRLGDTWKTGKWNIAINPDAWELMFDAIPSVRFGLEWEPCHQIEALADPSFQLREWAVKVFHVHGKDARVDRELIARRGLYGSGTWHASRFPGNGEADWTGIFRILTEAGFSGSVDIEGWNDSEWSGAREIPGQIRAAAYLRECRRQAGLTRRV